MSVSVGFIGAGNINRYHMKNAQSAGLKLVAVADVVESAAEDAKKQYSMAKSYSDYKQMLADKDVQAVIIGTPNKFHAEQAIASLNAGKHVFLEKPMAMNVAEADAIVAAAKKSGKTVQMGMINRFKGAAQTLKKFVESGRCGNIYAAHAAWYRRRGIPGFGG